HIAFNCQSAYISSYSKNESVSVCVNHIALKKDSEDNYKNALMKQREDYLLFKFVNRSLK
ncbi:hypothetical protein BDBG_17899, partial [Blastomyces gilchristii SLH14081]